MTKEYYKDGKRVARPKQLILDGNTYVPPTDAQIEEAGYEIVERPDPEPVLPSIEELVEMKLREQYSINQEFEVNRKRDTDAEAFATYYAYVEECIAWAEEQPHREEA